jgi:hypothetical protein
MPPKVGHGDSRVDRVGRRQRLPGQDRRPAGADGRGATREEALARLRELVLRPPMGQELSAVGVPAAPAPNPWAEIAGMFKDDPCFDEVVEIMAENRRKAEGDACQSRS